MFLVFEGADGSGKTTQSKALAEALRAEGREVVWTREPGGTRGAEKVRALLLDGDEDWSPETEMLLFNSARRDHVEKVIKPALARGAVVICDRFVGSTIAYQGARSPDYGGKARLLHDLMIGVYPDLTIYLERTGAQAHVDERGADRMERVQRDFMEKTREMFRSQLAASSTWRGVFADDLSEVKTAVLKIFRAAEANLEADDDDKIYEPKYYLDEERLCSYDDVNLSLSTVSGSLGVDIYEISGLAPAPVNLTISFDENGIQSAYMLDVEPTFNADAFEAKLHEIVEGSDPERYASYVTEDTGSYPEP